MQSQIVINDHLMIPRAEVRFSFARSAGPGGQNVNKVNTKAVLHWDVARSETLPEPVRQRLFKQCHNRINSQGELVLSSDRWREQGRNIGECLERLKALVQAAARPPKTRKATRPSRRAKEKRLTQKRHNAEKKASRRAPEAE